MKKMAEKKHPFLDLFDQFSQRHADAGFAPLRHDAGRRYRDLPLPSVRTEDWRFTNLNPLLEQPFALDQGSAELTGIKLPDPSAADALRLVFVNGAFAPALSSWDLLPRGLALGQLAQPARAALPDLEAFLGRLADYRDHPFTALNTALFADGPYVVVDEETLLERTIEIIHLAVPGAARLAINARNLIVIQPGAQARIVERYLGDGTYFTNAVTEIAVGAGAVVDHYKVQEEGPAAFHLANTQVVLQGGGNFSSHYVSVGGRLVRNEVRVRFDGQKAEATVNGLYLATGTQHTDNFTVIDHAQPHCASHELYKGILGGQASAVFNGKIFVRPDAQKTDAKQTNKALLLSDSATINTKPQLEIFADDVKCTHGATVGQLDAEQIYYLRSRGIGLRQAQDMLTFAFANDIVNRIQPEKLREHLEAMLMQGKP